MSYQGVMSDRTREILAIAEAMFAERGVKQTTVRQICAEAGIGSGSLYHHFGSKYDLVDRILSDFCRTVLDEYRAQGARRIDSPTRIRTMIRYAFSLVAEHAAAMAILLKDTAELVDEARFAYLVEFNDEIERRWCTAIAAAVADGSFRADVDIALFYRFMRGSVLGTLRWYRAGLGHEGKEMTVIADEYADIVLGGILR